MKKKNWIIFVALYVTYTAIYVARLNLSMASPEMKATDLLNSAQLGLLGSLFSVIYACGRLLNGILADRIAPWKMICIGLTVAGISNIAIGFMPPFAGVALFWSTNAFAQSMLWSSVLCVVSAMYDQETAKKRTTIIVTSVATGNIIGILLNTYLINTFGLRWAFIIPGAITLVLAAINIFLLKKFPAPDQTASKKHINIFSLLINREIRTAVVPAFLHGVMKDNVTLWMTVFFVDRYAINLEQSAWFVLFIPIVGFIGRSIYSLFYRLCKNQEHKVSVYGFAACVLFAVIMCIPGVPPVVAMLALSFIYAATSVINTSFLSIYPIHFVDTGNVASVSGVMDFVTYLGAGVASACYGVVIEKFSYLPMFVSWAVVALLGLLMVLRLVKVQSEELLKQNV
ncbi:MAG: MFS transporter [Ruminococcaceae bacterium]|nr:MFS transporter [Oscillospiraceae bacterium]